MKRASTCEEDEFFVFSRGTGLQVEFGRQYGQLYMNVSCDDDTTCVVFDQGDAHPSAECMDQMAVGFLLDGDRCEFWAPNTGMVLIQELQHDWPFYPGSKEV